LFVIRSKTVDDFSKLIYAFSGTNEKAAATQQAKVLKSWLLPISLSFYAHLANSAKIYLLRNERQFLLLKRFLKNVHAMCN